MKKNYLVVLISLMLFQVAVGVTPVDAFNLEVMRPDPNKEEEVPKHYFTEGVVKNDTTATVKEKMIVTTVVLPATWPYYYLQGLSKLVSFGPNNNTPFKFSVETWIGADSDYGKKFYVYVFLLTSDQLRILRDYAERFRDNAIPKDDFEANFINSTKYIKMSKKITVIRMFE